MASSSRSLEYPLAQILASRKRKTPSSKSEKAVDDAEGSVTVSPSGKGTLDGYLVKTPDAKSPPSARQNKNKSRAKKSLKLLADSQSDSLADYPSPFCPTNCRDFEAEVEDNRNSGPEERFDSNNLCSGDVTAEPRVCATRSSKELRSFAADFLSLYCGELPARVNRKMEHKFGGSKQNDSIPLQIQTNESEIKKEIGKFHDGSSSELVAAPPNEGRSASKESSRNHTEENVGGAVRFQVEPDAVDNDAVSCLRKCSKMPPCDTPGSVMASCNRRAPKYSHRSSIFSPGEEFWAEAIQVADGFGKDLVKAAHSNTGGYCGELMILENDGNSKASGLSLDISAIIMSKNEKKFAHHHASPLPVKHFDFSREHHSYEKGKSSECFAEEMKDKEIRGNGDVDAGLLTDKVFKSDMVSHMAGAGEDSNVIEDKIKIHSALSSISYRAIDSSKTETDNMAQAAPVFGEEARCHTGVVDGKSGVGTPLSSMPLKECTKLRTWLPAEVCGVYMKKGIASLYQWQVDCLQTDGVLERRNLVYCASTSAGKSLVAEILMLRRVILTGKMALLVLPYVSICTEKSEHLELLLEPLGKHVRSFYGNQGSGSLPKDTSVAVCTIEKANSLINRMVEEGRLSEVGIIVIDELHMVGDQHRGYLLELLLTKLRYASGEGNSGSSSDNSSGTNSGKSEISHGLQIVGMSATMPNVAAVADWLQAALYQTEFRPVPLKEYIKVGTSIFTKELDLVWKIPENANHGGKDPDHVVKLCDEVVQEGHSVLIFCSSRKGCESTAKHVAKYLRKNSVDSQESSDTHSGAASVIDALRRSPAGLDPVLEETIPSGVAYHHAGLTVEEREIVEDCFRKGLVRVLTATSTLAAGVNLPARRVIFRQPRIGRDFIDGTRYKQMSGRAGRTGIDALGESILICQDQELKRVKCMLNDSCPSLQSCLTEGKNGMTHAILEVVAGGIVQTPSDINRYVRCTLLNSTRPFEAVVKSAQDSLRWLCQNKFLQWDQQSMLYTATPLGRASFGSSLNPEESLVVLDDLARAREGFVLASDLHMVYIVTPINVDVEPDWEQYYERFMELSTLDQSVGNRVGVTEPFLMRVSHGAPLHFSESLRGTKILHGPEFIAGGNSNGRALSGDQTLRVAKRFYVALMLSRLVQEVPMPDVCDAFKVSRGMIQSLQENAGRFAFMVSAFCERLGWHDLGGLVSKFQNRVSFGVRSEIAELTNIPYVKGSRARALYKAGLRTPLSIAEASIPDIAKALYESSAWNAQDGNPAMRRIQLGMAKKIKNGARKIVLDQAEEARLAAFSAFKSLGVDVAHISHPLVLSNGNNTSPGSVGAEYKGHQVEVGSKAMDHFPCINSNATRENQEASFSSEESMLVAVNHVSVRTPKSDAAEVGDSLRKGPINACSFSGGFDSFLNQWDELKEFYFDFHFTKRSEQYSVLPFEVLGIAVCWKDSPVYYIRLPKDLMCSQDNASKSFADEFWSKASDRWGKICRIMQRDDVRKFTWNLKIQIQALKLPGISVQKLGVQHPGLGLDKRFKIVDNSHILLPTVVINNGIDLCLAAWILWPDEESKSIPNLEKTVRKRLSTEMVAAANRDGKWRNQMRLAAHNGCCKRVAQTRALGSILWHLLITEDLIPSLIHIENPMVHVLADMEHQGIGVDMEACLQARQILARKVRELEKEAYRLAGRAFSLYTPADVANILYSQLKLPVPECAKGKQHPSTDKQILEMLRGQHPIVPIIKEHRTLAKLLNCTLGSICSKAKLNVESQRYILRGHWLQTSAVTGRLSMEDPNLQCVEHMLEFTMNSSSPEYHQINARDFFVPTQEKWLLLVADYSQIELRLVAHFSQDSALIDLLSRPDGDVFTMIAARWKGKSESEITADERGHTKRLVYGILYGMGPSSLAEQLDCGEDEAAGKIRSFKKSFPAVSAWLQEAVLSCRQKGYIQTIKGRKRYLSKIESGNKKEKAKAERQAVNSICQGSAADIIKTAMIKIFSAVAERSQKNSLNAKDQEYAALKGRCHILLQVHDELVLEVDPSVLPEASNLLQSSMENAIKLNVPLRVKLMIGPTWGSLKPIDELGSFKE
ncbi:MUS308 and mammalian DNA polymerase-like protein isoform X2 [Wolffia australiana]